MVRVAIIGQSGKMGSVLTKLIEKDPELSLSNDPEVIIDFSSPQGTRKAIEMGKPLVCGTTGLTNEEHEAMKLLSQTVPVLYSPNFSLGIAFCMVAFEKFGGRLKEFSDISIEETHHTEKRDSPSGTALLMAKILGIDPTKITAKREGVVIGEHIVKFFLEDEELILHHKAYSRTAFAKGALAACKFILDKPPSLYNLSHIFC